MKNVNRNNDLMALADRAIKETQALFNEDGASICESYNGQVAALGVAIAMSGLLPALANYYQDKPKKRKVARRNILTVIATMIELDERYSCNRVKDSETLLRFAIDNANNKTVINSLKKEVEDCSIALKQVVRTYNLVKA